MSSGIRSIRVAPPAPPPSPAERLHVPRIVSVLLAFTLVAALLIPPNAFAATRSWSLSRWPSSVAAGPGSVSVWATNTGDDGGGEAIGCVLISVPNSGFSVSGVSIDAVSDSGDAWSASYTVGATDTVVRLVSNSGGGNRLHEDEWVQATVSFTTTGSDGTYNWIGNAFNKEDCTDDFLMPRTVTVTTNGAAPNTAPVGMADGYRVTKGGTLTDVAPGVLANDSDAEGDPLQAVLDAGPASGASLTLNSDGSFTYTPAPSFVGTDSFTYRASDGSLQSAATTVSITVSAKPIAVDDPSYITVRDTTLNVAAPGVLLNDTDPELEPLSASLVAGPGNGTVTLNADGSFSYVPSAGFIGTDSFTYTASDGVGTSNTATATITVVLPALAPIGVADAYGVAEDTTLSVAAPGLLANDTDPNGDPLTAALVTQATNGTATVNLDGSFTYVPVADFAGVDTFTYEARDASVASAPTVVTITVAPANDPPAAAADAYSVAEDGSLSVPAPGVLANDTDADGDALTAQLVSAPSSGSLTLLATGSFSYVPTPDFHGQVTFTYRARDAVSGSAPATVTITVNAMNDRPVAADDAATTPHGASVDVDVLVNDSDVDGDALALESVTQPASGTVTIMAGRARYTPAPGFVGISSFSYTVTDGLLTDSGRVTVTVLAPSPTPTPTQTPTHTPVPSPAFEPTPQPTADPTPQPTAEPTPSSDPTPTPEASGDPVLIPPERLDPAVPTVVVVPELVPLIEAQLTAAVAPGQDQSFGGFNDLFGGFTGSGFAWAVPAAMLGLPGLLFMVVVAVQVLGAAAWVPAIRRHLGGVGAARRRKRGAGRA